MAEAGPMFKKKPGGKRDVRARESALPVIAALSPATLETTAMPDEDEESTVVLKKRKLGGSQNPLLQATGLGASKRFKADWEEEDLKLDRYGESSVSSVVRSNPQGGLAVLDNKSDATRGTDWYNDSNGKPESGLNGKKDGANNDDGVYRGTLSYNTFMTARDDGVSTKSKAATKGPIQGGGNVRTITVVDYQPDVCKDYKETGYCGFGDTCKFMHDRSDYLAGWQLDLLPNSLARKRGDDSAIEEEIPFACLLCRKSFTDPVVTKCSHYFCSTCAIKRFSKTSKCFACGKQTLGIFNSAGKVLERMEKARKAREDEKDTKRWNRGDQDDQDERQQSGQLIKGVEIGNVE